jgi:anti-sigma factor RsiW
MRCSFFEDSLDAYVEGTLPAATRIRFESHAAACPGCAALLAEYRVVDALLLAPRQLEPVPNFTFVVMAEVRALPPPRHHRSSLFAILGTYVAFGWITIGAFLVFGGAYARAMLATIGEGLVRAGASVQSLAHVTGRTFGGQTFDVTAAMGGLLGADLVVVAGVVGLYAFRRSRQSANARATEPC